MPRPPFWVPVLFDEGDTVCSCPIGSFSEDVEHSLLVILILQCALFGSGLAKIVRIIRHWLHSEAGALLGDDLNALIERGGDHVLNNPTRILRTRRLPPRPESIR
jgi:hypothetical protein